jgi:hypothetical protein
MLYPWSCLVCIPGVPFGPWGILVSVAMQRSMCWLLRFLVSSWRRLLRPSLMLYVAILRSGGSWCCTWGLLFVGLGFVDGTVVAVAGTGLLVCGGVAVVGLVVGMNGCAEGFKICRWVGAVIEVLVCCVWALVGSLWNGDG